MKFILSAVALTLSATSLQANATNIVFKPLDTSIETQACLLAATEGLHAARSLVEQNDINFYSFAKRVTCNGESLKSFAKHSIVENNTNEKVQRIALVAQNSNLESQLCVDAIAMGESEARQKHNVGNTPIICNGKSLRTFVSKFKFRNVEFRQFSE